MLAGKASGHESRRYADPGTRVCRHDRRGCRPASRTTRAGRTTSRSAHQPTAPRTRQDWHGIACAHRLRQLREPPRLREGRPPGPGAARHLRLLRCHLGARQGNDGSRRSEAHRLDPLRRCPRHHRKKGAPRHLLPHGDGAAGGWWLVCGEHTITHEPPEVETKKPKCRETCAEQPESPSARPKAWPGSDPPRRLWVQRTHAWVSPIGPAPVTLRWVQAWAFPADWSTRHRARGRAWPTR